MSKTLLLLASALHNFMAIGQTVCVFEIWQLTAFQYSVRSSYWIRYTHVLTTDEAYLVVFVVA